METLRDILSRRPKGTTRYYPYTCSACGRDLVSTTSSVAGTERVCRSAKKCGNPERRQELLDSAMARSLGKEAANAKR